MRRALLLVFLGLSLPAPAFGDAAEVVLRLAPPDAALTLVVPNLRDSARRLLDSPLADRFLRLPAVRSWLDSPAARRLRQSRRDLEAALGTDLPTLRDDLLGDAAALVLRLPPGAGPDAAEGLLLTRVRDRARLEAIAQRINDAQRQEGTLRGLESRRHRDVSYTLRKLRPGSGPDEAFAVLDGGVFAWTNSESLMRATIDRQLDGGGLARDPRFGPVREALPPQHLAALYIDPRPLLRLASAGDADEPASILLRRYLEAVAFAGAALEWRDGPILHVHEALDPGRLDEPLRRWAARSGGAEALVRRMPPTAPVLAAGHVDFSAVGDLALGLVPQAGRDRAETALTALQGLFLGLDIRAEILPRLGPGVLAYVEAPADGSAGFPIVVALGLAGSPEDRPSLGAAVQNALRTVLALTALDAKSGPRVRLASREVRGVKVTSLVGGPRPISYAVGPGFVAFGSTPEAVGTFAGEPAAGGNPALDRLREAYFPGAGTYACADLEALHRLASARRDDLVRRMAADRDAASARRDLDAALDLIGLFRAAFAASRMEPDATAVHRALGLIAR